MVQTVPYRNYRTLTLQLPRVVGKVSDLWIYPLKSCRGLRKGSIMSAQVWKNDDFNVLLWFFKICKTFFKKPYIRSCYENRTFRRKRSPRSMVHAQESISLVPCSGILWIYNFNTLCKIVRTPKNNIKVTAREEPKILQISVMKISASEFSFSVQDGSNLIINIDHKSDEKHVTNVFGDKAECFDGGDQAAKWFSDFLGKEVRLSFSPER